MEGFGNILYILIFGFVIFGFIMLTYGFVNMYLGYYTYIILIYFLASIILSYLKNIPLKHVLLLVFPWMLYIFSNIVKSEFKDGLIGTIGWLIFYSFPIIPILIGVYIGNILSHKKKLISF